MSEATVSVVMITYNHERYIEQAVRSVLMQQADFDIEIIVGEDASTDATREVLRGLVREATPQLSIIEHDKNIGMQANFAASYLAARGEYIAILEGDDYWSRSDKLSIQVAAMEQNPHWSLCFHRVAKVDEGGRRCGAPFPARVRRETSTEDLLVTNYVPTCSILLRRSAVPVLPTWWRETTIGDWPLCVLASEQGALGFLPEVMACYRLHGASTFAAQSRLDRYERTLGMVRVLEKHLNGRFEPGARRLQASLLLGKARELARIGRTEDAKRLVIEAVETATKARRGASRFRLANGNVSRGIAAVVKAMPVAMSVFLARAAFRTGRVAERMLKTKTIRHKKRSWASDFQPNE